MRWFTLADLLFNAYYNEQKEHAVRLRRRMWGRLGNLLRHHPWCQAFRVGNFVPRWSVRIVKKWIAINQQIAKAKAKPKAKAKSVA